MNLFSLSLDHFLNSWTFFYFTNIFWNFIFIFKLGNNFSELANIFWNLGIHFKIWEHFFCFWWTFFNPWFLKILWTFFKIWEQFRNSQTFLIVLTFSKNSCTYFKSVNIFWIHERCFWNLEFFICFRIYHFRNMFQIMNIFPDIYEHL